MSDTRLRSKARAAGGADQHQALHRKRPEAASRSASIEPIEWPTIRSFPGPDGGQSHDIVSRLERLITIRAGEAAMAGKIRNEQRDGLSDGNKRREASA